ncbi:MAG: hypothetical protein NT126_12890 [Bacteroidetes bacterium]|nr:hypothetical protein [Bacteroidota bacterium]
MRSFLFTAAVVIIILLSFFLYSQSHSPILNSDGAISVLMTYDFQWSSDLYFWGQDRGGSLIPMLALLFYKVLHFSPLAAVSTVNYLLLIAGFIGFSGLFKTKFSIFVFSLLWFLPAMKFMELDTSPIAIQYCLIGLSIFIYTKHLRDPGLSGIKKHLAFSLVVLLLILSVWVSDSALITIFLLITILFLYDRKKLNRKLVLFYLCAGVVAGACFIFYAKGQAFNKTIDYLKLNDADSVVQSLVIIRDVFFDLLLFRSPSAFMSFTLHGALILLLMSGRSLFRLVRDEKNDQKKWRVFFLLDFILVFLAAVLSRWVFLNGTPARYFMGCYISFIMFFLLAIESIQVSGNKKRVFTFLMIGTVLSGSLSSPFYMKYAWPKTLRSQAEVFSELKSLGRIGIIAEYWHSYIAAVPDPGMIKATPHDQELVRNVKLVDEVFAQPNLYVFRFDWMNSFPDTLKQFGHVLIKEGKEFRIAGCDVNKYRKAD